LPVGCGFFCGLGSDFFGLGRGFGHAALALGFGQVAQGCGFGSAVIDPNSAFLEHEAELAVFPLGDAGRGRRLGRVTAPASCAWIA
jgi:hypothetical protein